jgi:hypothetical protein
MLLTYHGGQGGGQLTGAKRRQRGEQRQQRTHIHFYSV